MATVGLKGLWGLEQLDKTGIATWKLGLILMGAAGVAGMFHRSPVVPVKTSVQ